MGEFREVYYHRMRYFLSPQFDLYKNIRVMVGKGTVPLQVLDYGCGNGVGTVLLKHLPWRMVGVDSDRDAVSFAQSCWGHLAGFYPVDWARDDGLVAEPSIGSLSAVNDFDLITCIEVIEHVKDPRILLQKLAEAVRPKGEVYISTLNHNSDFRKNEGHIGRFRVRDFRELVLEFFPGARIVDYTLESELDDSSARTPMVAVWKGS